MRIVAFFAILLLLTAAGGLGVLYSFNHFSEISPVSPGRCTPLSGIAGPSDIRTDPLRNLAFVTSQDRRAPDARGGIHVFDLSDPLSQNGWRDRTMGVPHDFEPLGLDYFEDDEVRRLFVVNGANNAVEMFDVDDDNDLVHVATFSERRLTSPNSVSAVGRRSFYVTNDVRAGRDSLVGKAQFLFRGRTGDVFFVDGAAWRLVASGLRFANGVDVSPEGDKLVVAESSAGQIRVFDRDPETNAVRFDRVIKMKAAPDNLTFDRFGDLWVGAMPKPLAAPRLAIDEGALAPSEVSQVKGLRDVTAVFRSDGEDISASTIGARAGDKLLIGAAYDDKFLLCELPAGGD